MKHYVRYYVLNVYDSATTSAISLTLSALRRIPYDMRPQEKTRSSRKGIGVVKNKKCSGDRCVDFSFPLSRYFDRGVLPDKSVLVGNTVI